MIIDVLKNYKSFKRFDGEFGVEIETSTRNAYDVPLFNYWTNHRDDSIRNFGVEYVLKQPVRFKKELPDALSEFKEKTAKIKFIENPQSTSVHVHVNMLNESLRTLGNFLTLYTMFENLLIRYSGPDRLSNLFCLPMCDAEDTYTNIRQMFKQLEQKNWKGMIFQENAVKYAALNLAALGAYGSVELRSFRGETDTDKIMLWISLINAMLVYARKDQTPKDILSEWKKSQLGLLEIVFGPLQKEINYGDKENLQLIEKTNLFYAASIAYSIKEWGLLDVAKEIPKFNPKTKELDAFAVKNFGRRFAESTPGEQEYTMQWLRRQFERNNGLQASADINWERLVPNNFVEGNILPADMGGPPVPEERADGRRVGRIPVAPAEFRAARMNIDVVQNAVPGIIEDDR